MTPEFKALEGILRQHETELIGRTAQQFERVFNSESAITVYALDAARFLHNLAVVAVALYPSDTSIRENYRWASDPAGLLSRYHITYKHQVALLAAYFEGARALAEITPEFQRALDAVQERMSSVLADTYPPEDAIIPPEDFD